MPCGSRRHPTLPAVAPPAVPPLGLTRRVLPLGTVVWIVPHSRPFASPPCRGVLWGGGPPPATVIPLAPSPSPRRPRLLPWWVWEVGAGGGGGRPRCPSSGVSTSQARHWHVARHLSFCWGVGHAAWPPSSPCPLCVRSPGAPPRWGLLGACFSWARSRSPSRTLSPLPPHRSALSSGGGAAVRPSLPASPTLGGADACRGGGGGACRFPSVALAPQARGVAPVPLQGGGGFASRLPSSPLLSYARTPGGPPAGACTARALYGHGRVARPAPSYLCLPKQATSKQATSTSPFRFGHCSASSLRALLYSSHPRA